MTYKSVLIVRILLPFFVLGDSKLNMFRFGTVGGAKQAVNFEPQDIMMAIFHCFLTFRPTN